MQKNTSADVADARWWKVIIIQKQTNISKKSSLNVY